MFFDMGSPAFFFCANFYGNCPFQWWKWADKIFLIFSIFGVTIFSFIKFLCFILIPNYYSLGSGDQQQLAIVILIYVMVSRKQIFYEFKGILHIWLRMRLWKAILYFVWKLTYWSNSKPYHIPKNVSFLHYLWLHQYPIISVGN